MHGIFFLFWLFSWVCHLVVSINFYNTIWKHTFAHHSQFFCQLFFFVEKGKGGKVALTVALERRSRLSFFLLQVSISRGHFGAPNVTTHEPCIQKSCTLKKKEIILSRVEDYYFGPEGSTFHIAATMPSQSRETTRALEYPSCWPLLGPV